jgi:hypothetical protein
MSGPRRKADWILAVFLPHDRRDDLLADLDEEFEALVVTAGTGFAHRWYATQICGSIAPIIGRWLRVTTAGSFGGPPVGAAFFALATLWLVAVAWMIPPTESWQVPIATSIAGWRPGAVTLENGAVRPVYSLERQEIIGHFGTPALIRFSIMALAPPATAAIGVALMLAFVGTRRAPLPFPLIATQSGAESTRRIARISTRT